MEYIDDERRAVVRSVDKTSAMNLNAARSLAHETRLYHRLQRAAHALQRHADRAIAGTGLTTAQVGVLVVIESAQPTSQRSIAARLGLGETAMTGMLGRLEQLDAVESSADPNDGRVRLWSLTKPGAELLAAAATKFMHVNEQLDRALGDAVTNLAELLDDVVAAVDQETGALG